MIQFIMQELAALTSLDVAFNQFQSLKEKDPVGMATNTQIVELLNVRLPPVEKLCQKLKLNESIRQINIFKQKLLLQRPQSYSDKVTELETLLATFKQELHTRVCAFIPPDKVKYFCLEKLFGERVWMQFPSAVVDIENAGNCVAMDLHAGAVYYLMCIVNLGLISLARHMRVIIKKTPLEYAEWQTMIDKLEKKLKQKTIRPAGDKKQQSEARKFYAGTVSEFRFFKELRNDVMHGRSQYTEEQVINTFNRVRDFMQRLAEGGISEPE